VYAGISAAVGWQVVFTKWHSYRRVMQIQLSEPALEAVQQWFKAHLFDKKRPIFAPFSKYSLNIRFVRLTKANFWFIIMLTYYAEESV
jgi:hypothetical protein